jgi:hypothetical protein
MLVKKIDAGEIRQDPVFLAVAARFSIPGGGKDRLSGGISAKSRHRYPTGRP